MRSASFPRTWLAATLLFGGVSWSASASADVDARVLFQTLADELPAHRAPRALGVNSDVLSITAELPPGATMPRGLIPIAGRFAVGHGSLEQLLTMMREQPDVRFRWSPPLRPQLDQVQHWSRAASAHTATGLTGAGVVIGVIDTGVDTKHPAMRREDGSTRVRWLLDFALEPLSLHPELEEALGCTGERSCAVLSAKDIDERLNNSVSGDEPTDVIGHGTHVASIAAGNGAPDGRFVGSAPEADLIVAQVGAGPNGIIVDSNILTAARFIYDRAEELGQPAVINVSLGSDFGAHDGSSPLERGLVAFLDRPGRAMVTAAGNSAGQYVNLSPDYPSPFGIHTEVHVAGPTRVPILVPGLSSQVVRGAIFAWISSAPGDDLRVGFSTGRGKFSRLLPRGAAGLIKASQLGDADDYTVSILNGVSDDRLGITLPRNHAIVIISGEWKPGRTFGLRFDGHGSARIWVDGTGDLESSLGLGPLVPASSKAGTISLPASHPELIAVGATINRTSWTDHAGELIKQLNHGALENAPGDTTAYFSAAGPTNLGTLKPDIVAPGVHVVAAMSAEADPRLSGNLMSQFLGGRRCPSGGECFVVDDTHAVASGTSMAAPVVTGAVALLLQRDPTLTQAQVRTLLQAGSRPVEGVTIVPEQVGAGALDIVGALLAQEAATKPPSEPTSARLQLARSFAYPDPATPLQGLLILRNDRDEPATGFAAHRLTATASRGNVDLARVTEGLWQITLRVPEGAGGENVELVTAFDGQPLVTRTVPVAVDPHVAQAGFRASGGCQVAHAPRRWSFPWWVPTLFGGLVIRRFSRRPSAR